MLRDCLKLDTGESSPRFKYAQGRLSNFSHGINLLVIDDIIVGIGRAVCYCLCRGFILEHYAADGLLQFSPT